MSKKKKHIDQTTRRRGFGHSLSLAVTAASLGMTMGINPSDVLATPEQVERGVKEDSAATTETQRLAAGFMKVDDIKGESLDREKKHKKPIAVYPKVERPGAVSPKLGSPTAVFPKVERPGVEFHKVGKPVAVFPKVEKPGAVFPKVESPTAVYPKVERSGETIPKPEKPEADFHKVERPGGKFLKY